jgi:hypothetical protein
METSAGLTALLQKVLIGCGVLAAFLYAGTDILAGLLKKGYRFDSQSASVLSGFGTTTRPFVLPLNLIAGILLIAFAAGIWLAGGQNWVVRVMACLLAGNAILAMVAVAFFPMRPGEPVNTPANTMNVIIMATSVILFLLAIGFGAAGNQNWFRYYSIGTLLIFLMGFIISLLVTRFNPGMTRASSVGIQERTMIYAEMIWLALQAIVLLRV